MKIFSVSRIDSHYLLNAAPRDKRSQHNVDDALVSGVVDVMRRLLNEQRRELQQQDAHGVRRPERIVRVNHVVDEDADDVVRVLVVRRRRSANQSLTLVTLERDGEARDQHVLQNLPSTQKIRQ